MKELLFSFKYLSSFNDYSIIMLTKNNVVKLNEYYLIATILDNYCIHFKFIIIFVILFK